MALKKIVNGKEVELSPEEEAEVKKEWAENAEKERIAREKHVNDKALREVALQKIYAVANLSPEEIAVMKL